MPSEIMEAPAMTDAKYQDSSAIEALELVDDIELELQAVPVDYSVGLTA